MKLSLYFTFLFSFISYQIIAQEQILCPGTESFFKIENEADILISTTNNDGTLTLTHPTNQEITDIFINYEIYEFEQTFPSSPFEEDLKFYTIETNSKQLFIDLNNNTSEEIYSNFQPIRIDTSINNDFITLVDGREFRLSKYISTSDADGCVINCGPDPVPESLRVIVSFSYDPITELLTMTTTENTSCDNSCLLYTSPSPRD